MFDLQPHLDFALGAARAAGEVALSYYRHDAARERKKDGTWVTEADRAVEAKLRELIAEAWPEHNVLGEEEGLTGAGGGSPRDGAPTWVLDPIDGTNNFIAEVPIWATLVGLRVDGRSVMGVCHAPALGETYDGAEGLGARCNGDTIKVDAIDKLDDAFFVFASVQSFDEAGLKPFFDEVVANTSRSRGLGDFWGHMLVARGAAHIMVEPTLKPWDVVALIPIIEEAGGRITQIDGSEWADDASVLTTCGSLHDEIVRIAGKNGPGSAS